MNKAQIIGNLGKDPEIRTMQNGDKVCSFAVATSESWKDKATGERKEITEWHRVTVFNGHLIDVAEKYLRKGSKVYVEGQIKTRKWQDQEGKDRYQTEIVLGRFQGGIELLDRRPEAVSTTAHTATDPQAAPEYAAPPADSYDLDDEIPF